MDDSTQATFPEFKPTPMFEGSTEMPTPPATGKRKPGRPRKASASPSPAKTERKGKPRGGRRVVPADPYEKDVITVGPAKGTGFTARVRKVKHARVLQVPASALPALVGLKPEELSAVLQFADAIKAFGKKGRERIAAALGKLA